MAGNDKAFVRKTKAALSITHHRGLNRDVQFSGVDRLKMIEVAFIPRIMFESKASRGLKAESRPRRD